MYKTSTDIGRTAWQFAVPGSILSWVYTTTLTSSFVLEACNIHSTNLVHVTEVKQYHAETLLKHCNTTMYGHLAQGVMQAGLTSSDLWQMH